MVLIRGDTSVADIYLAEFFRLLNHLFFRYVDQQAAKTEAQGDPGEIAFLDEDASWPYPSFTPGRYHFLRRELFGVPPA